MFNVQIREAGYFLSHLGQAKPDLLFSVNDLQQKSGIAMTVLIAKIIVYL